jgi:glucose-6-phosphate isomerase
MQNATMQEMFQVDVTRTAKFHLKWNDFLIDYSKNIINQETMDLLLELANELKAISDYFEGKSLIKLKIECCTLHYEQKRISSIYVNGKNIVPDVYDERKNLSNEIIGGRTGYRSLLIL